MEAFVIEASSLKKIPQDLIWQDCQKFFPIAHTLVVLLNTGHKDGFRGDQFNHEVPSLNCEAKEPCTPR